MIRIEEKPEGTEGAPNAQNGGRWFPTVNFSKEIVVENERDGINVNEDTKAPEKCFEMKNHESLMY